MPLWTNIWSVLVSPFSHGFLPAEAYQPILQVTDNFQMIVTPYCQLNVMSKANNAWIDSYVESLPLAFNNIFKCNIGEATTN